MKKNPVETAMARASRTKKAAKRAKARATGKRAKARATGKRAKAAEVTGAEVTGDKPERSAADIVNGLSRVPHPYERFVTRILGMARKLELLAAEFTEEIGAEGLVTGRPDIIRRVTRLRGLSWELDKAADDIGEVATNLANSLPSRERKCRAKSKGGQRDAG
jgi:hypothetical protein